jgi:hypothetical protein
MYRVPIEGGSSNLSKKGEGGQTLYGYMYDYYKSGSVNTNMRENQIAMRKAVALSVIHCFSFDDIFKTD